MSKPFNFNLNIKSTFQNQIEKKEKFEKGSIKSHRTLTCIDYGKSLELEVIVSAKFWAGVGLGKR